MDIKTAFTYMFKDKSFLPKYLTGVLLLIPLSVSNIFSVHNPYLTTIPFIKDLPAESLQIIFLILSALGFLFSLFVCGYNFVNLNARIYKKDALLPEWTEFKTIILTSLKALAAYALLVAAISAIMTILAIVIIIILSLIFKSDIKVLAAAAISISIIIAAVAMVLTIPAQIIAFAVDLKIKSFYNFKLIFNFVKENKLKYFICLISSVVILIINSLVCSVSITKFYALAVFTPVITYYLALVLAEILASVPRPDMPQIADEQTAEQ